MLVKVMFLKNSIYGSKDEIREVTDRAASQYKKLGLIEYCEKGEKESVEIKEEKAIPETKEEKQVIETKEEKPKKAIKKEVKPKAKITKAPKF